MLSDHGQTQGATFKQRNGYGLDELVRRSLRAATSARRAAATRTPRGWGGRSTRRPAAEPRRRPSPAPPSAEDAVVVLGSGNLGLIYLMDRPHRLTLEEIEAIHPGSCPRCAGIRTSASCSCARPRTAPWRSAPSGARRRRTAWSTGTDPLAGFPATAAHHLRRTDGFPHVADLVINSFYDPVTEEGCAFEELISFHGGLGGPQTEPFILHPAHLAAPEEPIVGAEAVNRLMRTWREECNREPVASDDAAGKEAQHVSLDGMARATGPDR